MSDLRDLYQEVIFDHNRHPRNFGKLVKANRHAEGFNPLCGDSLDLYLIIDNDRIVDIKFEGQGCAISTASASLMTEALKGKTIQEAEQLFEGFHHLVTTGEKPSYDLGKLSILQGVSEFPARVKCASLSWHTLQAALHNTNQPVTTE